MKTCSYCGRQYPDDAEVCAIDQQPLVALVKLASEIPAGKVSCPQCGVADDFTQVIDPRRSFSLPIFLFSGLIAIVFQNAGKARRVRCNQCEARFNVTKPLNKVARVIFWLLIAASIVVWSIVVIKIVYVLTVH
ncbi:MAG TPA: hypothetical protein VGO57_14175 [Verrucomicrobiae bacterium]|jgi:uncharacterized Zn-finger protein